MLWPETSAMTNAVCRWSKNNRNHRRQHGLPEDKYPRPDAIQLYADPLAEVESWICLADFPIHAVFLARRRSVTSVWTQ